ncbi:MAG: hypothetical protein V4714_20855 [Bacteroidota bacterium]
MNYPIVLIHGYSDVPESFDNWRKALIKNGYNDKDIHTCGYRSLTNEVTIKDIAEGFDRALRLQAGLSKDEPFDAIVHSTGMLVLRTWLTTYAKRKRRLKRMIALAPASFGSPLAHKGRSWLGAIFKGNRALGPDFLDAGDLVLDGLELGSPYTWDLTHRDLLSNEVFYGPDEKTPYVFTFCGIKAYSGLQGLVTNPDGSDGTVRWAGCSLNTRKIILNLTLEPEAVDAQSPEVVISAEREEDLNEKEDQKERISFAKWQKDERCHLTIPFVPMEGLNHNTIIMEPSEELIKLVVSALQVSTKQEYDQWNEKAVKQTESTVKKIKKWQQFLVHAVDERGDPIYDYNIAIVGWYKNALTKPKPVEVDVHTYSGDKSYRCFHINLSDLALENLARLRIEIIASSGTDLLKYYGHLQANGQEVDNGNWTAVLEMDDMIGNAEVQFFYPFTTTLVELKLNREPEPPKDVNKVAWFHVAK